MFEMLETVECMMVSVVMLEDGGGGVLVLQLCSSWRPSGSGAEDSGGERGSVCGANTESPTPVTDNTPGAQGVA